jgi:hypothetical protein
MGARDAMPTLCVRSTFTEARRSLPRQGKNLNSRSVPEGHLRKTSRTSCPTPNGVECEMPESRFRPDTPPPKGMA